MRRFAVLCASAILMLTVSACGDDDSNDEGKAGDPASPTSSETSESPTDLETSESPTDLETSESPTDPETSVDPANQDFCDLATAEGFDSGGYEEIKGWAENMEGVTPPDDMTDEEKEGMELLVSLINKANSEAELNSAGDDVTDAQQKKLTAFITYVTTTCK